MSEPIQIHKQDENINGVYLDDLVEQYRVIDGIDGNHEWFLKTGLYTLDTYPREPLMDAYEMFFEENPGSRDNDKLKAFLKEKMRVSAERYIGNTINIAKVDGKYYATDRVTAFSMDSDDEVNFDAFTDPRWAVAYATTQSDGDKAFEWLVSMLQSGRVEEAYKDLHIVEGETSFSTEKWGALKFPVIDGAAENIKQKVQSMD